MSPATAGPQNRHLAAAAFVFVVLVAGTFFFWVGIPAVVLYGLAEAGVADVWHFVVGLITVPLAMFAFAPILFWLNALYLRITGTFVGEDPTGGRRRPLAGPLEPLLIGVLIVSVIALLVWFFFFAENPGGDFM